MSDREQIKAYYDTSPETEWARLEQNPWEFEINCRYIDRYAQPGPAGKSSAGRMTLLPH